MANKNNDGTKTFFLPQRSANTPKTGVKKTPGKVNTVIKRPTDVSDILNRCETLVKAGEILETPNTAIKVIAKIICKFRSR